jgi:hypothetical protein
MYCHGLSLAVDISGNFNFMNCNNLSRQSFQICVRRARIRSTSIKLPADRSAGRMRPFSHVLLKYSRHSREEKLCSTHELAKNQFSTGYCNWSHGARKSGVYMPRQTSPCNGFAWYLLCMKAAETTSPRHDEAKKLESPFKISRE